MTVKKSPTIARAIKQGFGQAAYEAYKRDGTIPPGFGQGAQAAAKAAQPPPKNNGLAAKVAAIPVPPKLPPLSPAQKSKIENLHAGMFSGIKQGQDPPGIKGLGSYTTTESSFINAKLRGEFYEWEEEDFQPWDYMDAAGNIPGDPEWDPKTAPGELPLSQRVSSQEDVIKETAQLQATLMKTKFGQKLTTFKGFTGGMDAQLATIKPGDVFLEKGFTSTSSDPGIAIDYAAQKGSGSHPFVMAVENQPDDTGLVLPPDYETVKNSEVLMPHGSKFLVAGVDETVIHNPRTGQDVTVNLVRVVRAG